jgi:hypothetical protein
METTSRIVGLLRFSVLTPTYFSERFDSLDQIAAHIFSDERMALRFRLFEALCLPSLVRQSDPDFTCVILTADSLPAPHMERLRALVEPYAHLRLMPVGTDNHYQLIRQGYDSVDMRDATHRVLFRLDDDDAVDLGYIARLRRLAEGFLKMNDPARPTAIAFNHGIYVRRRADGGENDVFDARERAPLSTGTALIAPVGYPRNPYRYNHRAIAQHYNTYSDISVPGFIRTIHSDNKSKPTLMGPNHRLKPAQVEETLRTHFGIDMATLKAL